MKRMRALVLSAALSGACLSPASAEPVITVEPRTQFTWEGKRVALGVSFKGTAPVSLQWIATPRNPH